MPLVGLVARWMRLSWEWAMVMVRAGKRLRHASVGMHCMLVILIFYCQHDDFGCSHVQYVCDGQTFHCCTIFMSNNYTMMIEICNCTCNSCINHCRIIMMLILLSAPCDRCVPNGLMREWVKVFPSTSWFHIRMIFFLNFWNSMSASTSLWQPSNAVQLVGILFIVFTDYGVLCLLCLWLCQTVVQKILETSEWSAPR